MLLNSPAGHKGRETEGRVDTVLRPSANSEQVVRFILTAPD